MPRKVPTLNIVIPCYNEQEVLPVTMPMFLDKLNQLVRKDLAAPDSSLLLVNDGSKDDTWQHIMWIAEVNPQVTGVSLSRNRGHQNALLCGLSEALDRGCDCAISIDCDGQDDLDAMDEMLAHYIDGADIVYGVRSDRTSDSWFKRTTAQGFYKVMASMGVESVYNHADYRLMSARALRGLLDLPEVNLFLRGMVPLVGYRSEIVTYSRHERLAGESHYPLSKMVGLAIDGITSLSIKPIRLITTTGAIIGILSVLTAIITGIMSACGMAFESWLGLALWMSFLVGVQLVALGVVGEYVGKAYIEAKRRPRFVVEERTWDASGEEDAGEGKREDAEDAEDVEGVQ